MEIVPKQRPNDGKKKIEGYIGSMTSLKCHLGNEPLNNIRAFC